MEPIKIERIFNKKGEIANLIIKNRETQIEFRIIGGVTINNEEKIVIENKEQGIKKICSFSKLKKKYYKTGQYND